MSTIAPRDALVLARTSMAAGEHAWVSLVDEAGVARAADVGADAPLAGVPFGAKDNLFTVELPATGGTPALRGFRPSRDAGCIARLRAAGAVLIGKTNMHELGLGVTSENAAFGTVRNPAAPGRVAGGSSGGSAAAVAAGHVPFALATDTGGSARLPAAFCGVVGFRPSTGRWPLDGVVPISWTRDTPGIIASSIDWVARVDAVLAEPHGPIASGASRPARDRRSGIGLSPLRLGVARGLYGDPLDDRVAIAYERALAHLRQAGATLVEFEVDDLAALDARIGFPVAVHEASRSLRAFCAQAGVAFDTLVDEARSPDVAAILRDVRAGVIPEAVYRDAIDVALPRLRVAFDQAFARARVEAVLAPACPVPPPAALGLATVSLAGAEHPLFPTIARNTSPASLIGLPSISVPIASTAGELPCGLLLEARRGDDRRLLSIASQVAACVGLASRAPSRPSATPP